MSDKKPKKGPEPLKAYVAFKQKVTYASSRRSPSPVTSVPIVVPSTTPVRGLSPVQSYLQSQWPRDIRNSLSVNVESTQTEPIVSQTLDNDENAESCENCIIKSLTEEGTALRELKRIRQVFLNFNLNFFINSIKGKNNKETNTTATTAAKTTERWKL